MDKSHQQDDHDYPSLLGSKQAMDPSQKYKKDTLLHTNKKVFWEET